MYKMMAESKGLVTHGVSTCQGCGLELIMRNVMEALGEDIVLIIPPGCSAMFSGSGIEGSVKVPGIQGNLENSAAIASGIANGFRHQGNTHTKVVAFAGEGATVDIGLQALSGAMERNENILYICYDNEAYMNTGIQGSSSTPAGGWTTTTPAGKLGQSKDLMRIVMAHDVPYAASASIANLPDLKRKVKKARETVGTSVLHIQCPCPTGWGYPFAKSIELAREAVQSGAWLLMEFESGKVKISQVPKKLGEVEDYIKPQRRFRGMSDAQLQALKEQVAARYEIIKSRAEA